jgi:hypothetical protein
MRSPDNSFGGAPWSLLHFRTFRSFFTKSEQEPKETTATTTAKYPRFGRDEVLSLWFSKWLPPALLIPKP